MTSRYQTMIKDGLDLAEKSWPGDTNMQLLQFASWVSLQLTTSETSSDRALAVRFQKMMNATGDAISAAKKEAV